jgi:DNA-binding HxlR family transcriptional regulator
MSGAPVGSPEDAAIAMLEGRWVLRLILALRPGPRRFKDLKERLAGVSANTLQRRLERLEHAGFVTRSRLPPPADVPVYTLTSTGQELGNALHAVERWAARQHAA